MCKHCLQDPGPPDSPDHFPVTVSPTNSSLPPDPNDDLSPLTLSISMVNLLSQLLLPAIPAAFLHTVSTILGE